MERLANRIITSPWGPPPPPRDVAGLTQQTLAGGCDLEEALLWDLA